MKVPKDNPVQRAKQTIRVTVTATTEVALEDLFFTDEEDKHYANDEEVLFALQKLAANSNFNGDVTQLLLECVDFRLARDAEAEFALVNND